MHHKAEITHMHCIFGVAHVTGAELLALGAPTMYILSCG